MWVRVSNWIFARQESHPCGFKSQAGFQPGLNPSLVDSNLHLKKNGFKTAKCNLPSSTKNSESGVKAWRIISSKQSGFLELTFFFFFFYLYQNYYDSVILLCFLFSLSWGRNVFSGHPLPQASLYVGCGGAAPQACKFKVT